MRSKAAFVQAKILHIMPAVDGLGSATALKYRLGLKSRSFDSMGFEALDGQKGDPGQGPDRLPNYWQAVYVLIINGVMFILKVKQVYCQFFKMSLIR